jgi:uncharacterized protein YjbJ (UPF0337 family)
MAEPSIIPGQNLDAAEVAPRAPALPEQASPASNPRLNQTAENIGAAVGNTVREIKDIKDRFRAAKDDSAESAWSAAAGWKQRAGESIDDAKQRASRAVQAAGDKASEVLNTARQRASDAVDTARAKASENIEATRRRATHVANEYPVHVVLGAAGAAFALGIALRIWRSSRD